MNYKVNNETLQYEPTGGRTFGENVVLLNNAVDLTTGTSWNKSGFTIEQLFEPELHRTFLENTQKLLKDLWLQAGLTVNNLSELEHYHLATLDQETHLKAIEKTKLLSVADFPINIKNVEQRISEICNEPLVAKNPFDNQSIFHFRIIRPNNRDNNPLHRDVWLEDYKDCINLYIPVAGSDERSSLILAPGSHHWPESKLERTIGGATINGVKFNVPAVTAIEGAYNFVRPNPSANEVLLFSPYLIHGGAVNLNTGKTRISIELRLWKK